MKKAYSKPDVFFEDFTMSTNIAAGCEEKPVNFTDECGVLWGHRIIFTSAIANCTSKVDGELNEYNGLCYHNPNPNYNVFTS